MATLADPSWVEYWIELGDVHILDARPASQYAQGHLPDAVSLPLEKILGPDGFCCQTIDWLRYLGRRA